MKKQNQPDMQRKILEIFQKQWNDGNPWMVHILTKSPLILNHLDILKDMKHMVQVEISFSTENEIKLRELEMYTPSFRKRLATIEKLSAEGIFVRVMAMPFYGNKDDLLKLKEMTFNSGAKALKNKALNYYNWQDVRNISEKDLIAGKLLQSGNRKDTPIDSSLNILSGEPYLENGNPVNVDVLMPNHKAWTALSKLNERMVLTKLNKINCGYTQLSGIDWGYIK